MLRVGNSALTENKAHSSYLSAAGSAHVTSVGNMAQTREEDETSQVNNSNRKQKLDQLRRIQEEKKKKVVQEVGSVLIFFHLTTHQGCV